MRATESTSHPLSRMKRPGSCSRSIPATGPTTAISLPFKFPHSGRPQSAPRKTAPTPRHLGATGCHYDIKNNRAFCETGGCGDQYDCSAANLGPSGFTTITEWTFYQKDGVTFVDISTSAPVNGASLTVDPSCREWRCHEPQRP